MEPAVVLHASKEQKTIVQSRRLGLTGMDGYIYIYANTKQQSNVITCLALQLGNNMESVHTEFSLCRVSNLTTHTCI